MKTSIATVCISGDLREKLAAIASAGFDGVEIFENDFLAFDGTPAEVGRTIRDHATAHSFFSWQDLEDCACLIFSRPPTVCRKVNC